MNLHFQDIQFVVGSEGKTSAVIVDIELWDRILQALEDAEDIGLAKEALSALDAAGGDPAKAGFLRWEEVRDELEMKWKINFALPHKQCISVR